MADVASALSERLATSATGWGAVIDGVLNIRSVTETANMAALNAFALLGFAVGGCADPDCDCVLQALSKLRPDVRIVPVSVEVEDV